MLIIKKSFRDYLESRLELDEMAIAPTPFKNNKGEFEGEYHVQSTSPVFMDWIDIYYLYQFPPTFWIAALNHRYKDVLYNVKTQGDKYQDIQNVTLKGRKTVTFSKRNTFGHYLLDKMERAIDMDHFRKSSGTPEEEDSYQSSFTTHKAAGRDLGGHIGVTLADPKKHKNEDGEEVWVSKGLKSMNLEASAEAIKYWVKGSTQGWLKDLRNVDHKKEFFQGDGLGGPGNHAVLKGKSLEKIQAAMKNVGAVPFKIVDAEHGTVKWPNALISDKKGSTNREFYSGKESGDTEFIPVLYPGKVIDSPAVNSYESNQELISDLNSIDDENLSKINSNLSDQIKKMKNELEEKDLNMKWDKKDFKKSKDRQAFIKNLNLLMGLENFKKWFSVKHPGVPLTVDNVKKSTAEFVDYLKANDAEMQSNSKKYSSYGWNMHKFNRSRHPYDPLGTGMDNPLEMGKSKYPGLRDKTIGFGVFHPNRNSKEMIHSTPGDWEDNFKPHFGHGMDPVTGKVDIKSPLSIDDHNELSKKVHEYFKKIAQKLASNKEAMEFLDNNTSSLLNSESLKRAIHSKVRSISDESIPEIIRVAYGEMSKTETKLSELHDEVSSGKSPRSAIEDGVKKYLGSGKVGDPRVRSALQSIYPQLVFNAENFVRRSVGESAFRNFLDKTDSPTKYKNLLDLRAFIAEKADVYVATIAQLDLGEVATRRLRDKFKTTSSDASMGDGDASFAGTISDDDKMRKFNKAEIEQFTSPEGLEEIRKGIFSGNSSDYVSGKIGRSNEVMYEIISKATERVKVAQADLAGKLDYAPTASEKDMVTQLSASMTFFNLFKQKFILDAMEQGLKSNAALDKEAAKYAQQQTTEYLNKHKYAVETQPQPDHVSDFKNRFDNDQELDSDEQIAASIIAKWDDEGLTPAYRSMELERMVTKAKINNDEQNKKIVDLVLIAQGREPILGTMGRMAASATGGVLPDANVPIRKTQQAQELTARIQAKIARIHAQQAAAPAPTPVAPQAPVVPKPSGLGGFMKQAPVAPVTPKPSGLGGFMKRQPPQV